MVRTRLHFLRLKVSYVTSRTYRQERREDPANEHGNAGADRVKSPKVDYADRHVAS